MSAIDTPSSPNDPPAPSADSHQQGQGAAATEGGERGGNGARAEGGSPVEAGAEGSAAGPQASAGAGAEGGAAAGGGAGGEGAPGAGAPGAAPGTPGKKRRRRRRKKGAGAGAAAGAPGTSGPPAEGEEAAGEGDEEGAEGGDEAATKANGAGAEGAAAEGGDKGTAKHDKNDKKRDRKKKDRKDRPPQPPRERPAFAVGDVVFGKITDITDDALLVDLSGKARAVFDRKELELPDEPHPARRREGSGALPQAAPSSPGDEALAAADADAGGSVGETAELGEADTQEVPQFAPAVVAAATASADAADGTRDAAADAAVPPADAPAAAADAGATEAGAAEAAPEAVPNEPVAEPYAPPVILELGAHFVGIVHQDGGRGGLVVLTRHPNRYMHAKPVVAQAFKDKTTISGLVTGVIKGGVEVDVSGLRAFAPASHMELRLGADLHPLVGRRLDFYVTQYGKKGRDLVLSRRAMLETEAKANREAAIAKLPIGGVVEGVVRSVVPFGAFIDVGGVEGLVPLTEMSHNRSDQPADVFKVGEKVPVKILRVDEKGKVWLSRRATVADPWGEVAKKYAVGTRHTGKVARLQPFGAFVELEPGVDGLVHTADLSIKRIEHPSDVVKVGDPIEVVVSNVDSHAHKIGLHPAPSGAAADETPQRVQVHKVVKVSVVAIEAAGLVVRILGATGRHARGFITAAATGTPRGTELRKLFPVGKELDAKVVELDAKRGEVKLSIKAMNEDSERSAYKAYQAQVKRDAKFGTFGDLLAKKLQNQK